MILIDSNVLIALANPQDELYRVAVADALQIARRDLIITWPVLAETFHLLPDRFARARIKRLMSELAAILPPTGDDFAILEETMSWLERYAEHEPDLTDAYLIAMTSRDRRYRVWTYDREFRTVWRRLDGSAVPLALPARRRR